MRRISPILAVLFVVAILATFATLVWRTARAWRPENLVKPGEETVDLAAIVMEVRDLNRLETVVMHVMQVGTITQSYRFLPDALAGDQMTFLAVGDVIAGIDLSQLGQHDVWREPDGTVNLRLPPPQILVSRLDNRQSHVLVRDTGVLRRSDVDLESRMRQHAETAIRLGAVRKGILTLAERNAEPRLAAFLHSAGVQKVRFVSSGRSPQM